ncbi:MAG: PIN domain-containing protein [Balneolaceae bacterium]|nr:PIN domain-containing protein [Balneolaceae bacterium]
MYSYVADTMALILWLEKRKMPPKVKKRFLEAAKKEAEIIIPSMVFAELGYLSEKGRIDTNLIESQNLIQNNASFKEHTLSFSTIQEAFKIEDISELHDRLISAAGKELNLPILTNDPEIHRSKYVVAIWD